LATQVLIFLAQFPNLTLQISCRNNLAVAFNCACALQVLGLLHSDAVNGYTQLLGQLVHAHIARQQQLDSMLLKSFRVTKSGAPGISHHHMLLNPLTPVHQIG
jgi:hypothetical protein